MKYRANYETQLTLSADSDCAVRPAIKVTGQGLPSEKESYNEADFASLLLVAERQLKIGPAQQYIRSKMAAEKGTAAYSTEWAAYAGQPTMLELLRHVAERERSTTSGQIAERESALAAATLKIAERRAAIAALEALPPMEGAAGAAIAGQLAELVEKLEKTLPLEAAIQAELETLRKVQKEEATKKAAARKKKDAAKAALADALDESDDA